ncbi:MAG: ECF-type sigma factor, partial [Planctomycetota bacterium]
HFVAAAAIAMRQISIDRIRARERQKRGGGCVTVPIDESCLPESSAAAGDLGDVEVAISDLLEVLSEERPRCARIVEMRFYLGLTEVQCADALGLCERTVRRDWVFARAWLSRELRGRGIDGFAVES